MSHHDDRRRRERLRAVASRRAADPSLQSLVASVLRVLLRRSARPIEQRDSAFVEEVVCDGVDRHVPDVPRAEDGADVAERRSSALRHKSFQVVLRVEQHVKPRHGPVEVGALVRDFQAVPPQVSRQRSRSGTHTAQNRDLRRLRHFVRRPRAQVQRVQKRDRQTDRHFPQRSAQIGPVVFFRRAARRCCPTRRRLLLFFFPRIALFLIGGIHAREVVGLLLRPRRHLLARPHAVALL
mmetsp:Transcript_2851/g.8595  ORF Transcript_2851/g.8595 Transcript_2851/m.8595 type:complete len:238 (+) Transcript_2851:744-1457(+)